MLSLRHHGRRCAGGADAGRHSSVPGVASPASSISLVGAHRVGSSEHSPDGSGSRSERSWRNCHLISIRPRCRAGSRKSLSSPTASGTASPQRGSQELAAAAAPAPSEAAALTSCVSAPRRTTNARSRGWCLGTAHRSGFGDSPRRRFRSPTAQSGLCRPSAVSSTLSGAQAPSDAFAPSEPPACSASARSAMAASASSSARAAASAMIPGSVSASASTSEVKCSSASSPRNWDM